MKLKVLDLFCGAGGISEGFQQAGYDIVAGVDFKEDAVKTFRENHDGKGIEADLSEVSPEEIESELDDDVNVVVGGPPCQGFSIANRNDTDDDERNTLVDVFLDYVEYFSPKAVMMENVPAFKRKDYPKNCCDSYGEHVLDRLEKIGYSADLEVLNAAKYGVPQKRKRAIVQATKQDEPPSYPDETHVIPE